MGGNDCININTIIRLIIIIIIMDFNIVLFANEKKADQF